MVTCRFLGVIMLSPVNLKGVQVRITQILARRFAGVVVRTFVHLKGIHVGPKRRAYRQAHLGSLHTAARVSSRGV